MPIPVRNLPYQTRRDAWVEVDLGHLEHNVSQFRRWLPPQVSMMAIVKADAYGHGAAMIIPTLEASGVSMVGVAATDEALALRKAGVELPILVIGAIPEWALAAAVEHRIALTIFTPGHLQAIERFYAQSGQPVDVHIKVDTGMHRIGVDFQEAAAFVAKCQASQAMRVQGVFTHLACAEDMSVTHLQLERWQAVVNALSTPPPLLHVANTAGAIGFTQSHFNMVRIGLGLYGYTDDLVVVPPFELKPVMGLKARVVHLQQVPPGSGISYGYAYHTPIGASPGSVIATLPLGYADGIPRALSNRLEVLVHGQRVPQVGHITMDQIMIDVTNVPSVQVGDTVTLLGCETAADGSTTSITMRDWCAALRNMGVNTNVYEPLCALRVRLPKTYTRTSM